MLLTVHRGTHEIGGTCVELAAGDTRLILDAGLPLVTATRERFDARTLRGKSPVELRASGILPPVRGLFAPDGPSPAALLFSHVHLDHTGLLPYVRPEVPIVLSKGTSKMLLAGSIFAGMPRLARERSVVCRPGEPLTVGHFRVTAYPVDHSAFDSMAFLIEAEGKTLLYSGDLRLHGRKPGMARRLLQALAGRRVDALLMEGTHVGAGRERGVSEHDLEEQVLEHVRSAPGLVLAAFSPLHVDRLVTFYKAARRAGRTFVVDPYGAFVMRLVSGQCRIPPPTRSAGIRVYYNAYFESTYRRRNLAKVHGFFTADRIELAEMLADPVRYLLLFRPSMLDLDFAGTLPARATCLYSYWGGYLDNPDWVVLREKLADAAGLFAEAHTSGHIFADDIVSFVRAVNPARLVPVHTFAPDLFHEYFPNTLALEDGQTVPLT
jgi:ribonuclease J